MIRVDGWEKKKNVCYLAHKIPESDIATGIC